MSLLSTFELERMVLEDAPYGDLTTEALEIGARPARIQFAARGPMVVAAIEEAAAIWTCCGVRSESLVRSGERVARGQGLLKGEGLAKDVLRAWKISQTLVEIWSGVASAAQAVVVAARSSRPDVVVACTRKTPPGVKALAIAAIKAGGAVPHRLGLSETILLFPEHRALAPEMTLSAFARHLRARAPERKLVVEVNSVSEAIAAAEAGFDVVQAEKFTPEDIRAVVAAFCAGSRRPLLAAAGGIDPGNAAAYAEAGADVLVTSWPYTARPADVAVTIRPA